MTTFKPAEWPRKLRSQHWYGGNSRDTIYHRGWLKNQGYPHDLFDGRPVIGILNTWSDLTPCNGHLRELAEKVKAGVWEAGGFPVEVPVFSAVLTPQQFHETEVHYDFFRKHFVIKGIEVAEACANTLHSLERLRGQVAAGIPG